MSLWKTQDGDILAINEMETSHIKNCIKMLERHLTSKPDEAIYTGDNFNAEQAVESENRHNDQLAENIRDQIKEFTNELDDRASSPITRGEQHE